MQHIFSWNFTDAPVRPTFQHKRTALHLAVNWSANLRACPYDSCLLKLQRASRNISRFTKSASEVTFSPHALLLSLRIHAIPSCDFHQRNQLGCPSVAYCSISSLPALKIHRILYGLMSCWNFQGNQGIRKSRSSKVHNPLNRWTSRRCVFTVLYGALVIRSANLPVCARELQNPWSRRIVVGD